MLVIRFSPRAIGYRLTLPGGQYRTLRPRGPSPVVPLPVVLPLPMRRLPLCPLLWRPRPPPLPLLAAIGAPAALGVANALVSPDCFTAAVAGTLDTLYGSLVPAPPGVFLPVHLSAKSCERVS